MNKVKESNESNQLECQLWRVYNLIHRTSIFCESQEECEHMIQHFVEDEKRSFSNHSDANHITFDVEESLTPLGWEVILFAEEVEYANKNNAYKCTIRRHAISHYIYYHDTDEEAERERIKKVKETIYKDTDSISVPTLTATVRGEACKFVANSASPTDWTAKNDESSNYLRIDKEMVKECIEALSILLDCVPKSDNLLKIMEDQKETFLINLKPSSFKYVISKVLDLITPF